MDCDYELTIPGNPRPQGRPRTRIVQTKIHWEELFRAIRARIAIIGEPNEPDGWDTELQMIREVELAAEKRAFATIYEDGKDKRAKVHIQSNVRSQAPAEPLTGPLEVELWFWLQRPQSDYGTGRNAGILKKIAAFFHIKKPDFDNLTKLTTDALTGIFWNDDSQICDAHIHKRYSKTPKTTVLIEELQEEGLFE